jgi:hypothetical protein
MCDIPMVGDLITREFPLASQPRNAAAGTPGKLSV